MPFRETNTSRYFYRHWQSDQPRAHVLLLHGFGEHTGHYHRFAAALNTKGFDVWGIDHIGHGQTGGQAGHFESVAHLEAHAKDLALHIWASNPNAPLVICGHSLGGITAARLALHLSPSPLGLVLTGTPFEGLPVIKENAVLTMSLDAAYLDDLENDPFKFDTTPAEANLWKCISQETQGLRTGLASIQLPVLLINGEHDVFAPPALARAWAKNISTARVIEIPGGYHDIPNDVSHRQVVTAITDSIDQWLK